MFCEKCGKELPNDALFCTICGNRIIKDNEQTEQITHEFEQPVRKMQPVSERSRGVKTSEQKNFNNLKKSFDTEKVAETVKEKTKGINKPIVAVIVAVVAIIVIIILLSSNSGETGEIKDALKNNDASSLYYAYYGARGDYEKIQKYDELVGKKIDDMIDDLEDYDFEKAVKSSDDAVLEWQSKFGSLLDSDGDYDLYDSISSANEAKMTELEDKIDSKDNFCSGLYAMNSGDYKKAISYFTQVSEADDDIKDVNKLIEDCANSYIETVLSEVDAKINNGDMSGGLDLLNDAVEELSSYNINIDKVNSKIEEIKQSYASTYAQKAEEAFKNKDAKGAVGNIDVAIELQPNNSEYKVKRSTYEQYYPFALYDLDNAISTEGYGSYIDYEELVVANDNSELSNVIDIYLTNTMEMTGSATYNLKGKYDTVTGKIFVAQRYKSQEQLFYIEAYADGTLIYTSPKMEKGTLPQDISFNVTNVQNLEIQFWGESETSYETPRCFISNLVAQKNFPQ